MSSEFLTAPPKETGWRPAISRTKQQLVAKASSLILPVMKKAAAAYLGGETIDEALSVARRLLGEGHASTLGYWDIGRDNEGQCITLYCEAIRALADTSAYLSLKPPALHFSKSAACELAKTARTTGLRLHCDSHGEEQAAPSHAFAEALLETLPPEKVGITLPGRWHRSLGDAEWAIAHGLPVRVVKGQWPDATDPKRDIAKGYLEVIDVLAKGASHVAVATHDLNLAREAVSRLKTYNVSCEIEVLLGMPAKPLLAWAKDEGVRTRIYVPYGPGFVPNAIGVLRRNPRLLLAVAKERANAAATFLGVSPGQKV